MANEELKHYGVKGMKWRKHKTKAKQALDDYHKYESLENQSRYHLNQNNIEWRNNKEKLYELRKKPLTSGTQAELIKSLKTERGIDAESDIITNNIREDNRAKNRARTKWKIYSTGEKARLNRIHAIKSVGRKANQLRVAGKKKMAKLKSQMAKMSLK